ncbi:MAG: PD-(D/E)XK nuclease family protein [Lachnospiraceae bacterium]|nr:PD-(D/E)XK nuclease family protein [Lachnospiraceae bacterium]
MRTSFYQKIGAKETNPVSPAVTLMGYMGMKIEDGLIDLIKNMGLWENNNVKWQAKGLSGEVDVICREDNDLWIVECKSCSGYHANKEVFGYMSGRGSNKRWVPGKPKIKHLMQAAIYADIGKGTCKGALIIYISRDEAKMQEFLITIDDQNRILIDGYPEDRFTMNDIYQRYQELQGYIDQNILPAPEYKHTYTDQEVDELLAAKEISAAAKEGHTSGSKPHMDKECSYCGFRNLCMKDGMEERRNYALGVMTDLSQQDSLADDWIMPETKKVDRPAHFASGSF